MYWVIGDPRALRQEANKHRQVLQAGNDLLDADRGDVQLRHVGRQICVALVGADDECPGLGDHEIAPRHARVGVKDQRSGCLPLCFCQIVDVTIARVGADRT